MSYDSQESIELNHDSVPSNERKGELNVILTISGLVDTKKEASTIDDEEIENRFVSISCQHST